MPQSPFLYEDYPTIRARQLSYWNDIARSKQASIVTLPFLDDLELYARQACPGGLVTTNLITYVVPDGRQITLISLICGGNDNAEFTISLDGQEVFRARDAWTDRVKPFDLGFRVLRAGVNVTVDVLSKSNNPGLEYFEARLNTKIYG